MKRIGILNSYSFESDELKSALNHIRSLNEYEIETIEDFKNGETISGSVWGLINLCDVLIALINKKSENLYYQIGLAHGAGKPVIIVTDDEYSLPPDLRGQRILNISQGELFDEAFLFRLKEAIAESQKRYSGLRGPREEIKEHISKSVYQPSFSFRDLFVHEGPRRNKYFEEWFSELASGIEDWEVIKSDYKVGKDQGFDLVIWNSLQDSELAVLGNPIAVEIKAIRSMNTSMWSDFLHRSKKSGINGLILATTGLNDRRTRKLLDRLRKEEGINAIALDRDDLININNSGDLLVLIKGKVRELLYGQNF